MLPASPEFTHLRREFWCHHREETHQHKIHSLRGQTQKIPADAEGDPWPRETMQEIAPSPNWHNDLCILMNDLAAGLPVMNACRRFSFRMVHININVYIALSCFLFSLEWKKKSGMMQLNTSSEPKETQPLVRQDTDRLQKMNRKCNECCPVSYRSISISDKGAIFMIVLNAFLLVENLSCIEHILKLGPAQGN